MFEIFGILAISNVYAPWKALNLPSLKPLRITSTSRSGRGMSPCEWNKYWHGDKIVRGDDGKTRMVPELKEVPAMLVIGGVNGDGRRWDIAIDLEEGTVGNIVWADLTHYEYGGSGEIGLMIFGLPGLLVSSPLWLTTNLIRGAIKLLTPFDVDHWEVWLKLWPQLKGWDIDPKVVWKALRAHQLGRPNSHNTKRAAEYEAQRQQERIDALFENWKDDPIDGPFMTRYANGCAEDSEVMKDYETWQRRCGHDQNVRAWEWLGMSESEFQAWYKQEKTVLQLLQDREAAAQQSSPATSGDTKSP